MSIGLVARRGPRSPSVVTAMRVAGGMADSVLHLDHRRVRREDRQRRQVAYNIRGFVWGWCIRPAFFLLSFLFSPRFRVLDWVLMERCVGSSHPPPKARITPYTCMPGIYEGGVELTDMIVRVDDTTCKNPPSLQRLTGYLTGKVVRTRTLDPRSSDVE
jgi:hypothetical protein